MKSLIVDDEITSRLVLKKFLSAFGEAMACKNGPDAIEAFTAALSEGSPFDLVCMDVMMPGMDGPEAVRRIRAIEEQAGVPAGSRARILMATGLDIDDDSLERIEGLYDGILRKPVRTDALKAVLAKFIASPPS